MVTDNNFIFRRRHILYNRNVGNFGVEKSKNPVDCDLLKKFLGNLAWAAVDAAAYKQQ